MPLSEGFEPLTSEAEKRPRASIWHVVRYSECHGYAVVVEDVVDLWPALRKCACRPHTPWTTSTWCGSWTQMLFLRIKAHQVMCLGKVRGVAGSLVCSAVHD